MFELKNVVDFLPHFGGGGGGSPAFCRCLVGRFAAMIVAKSGKFYAIFNIAFSLNKQVLPDIL